MIINGKQKDFDSGITVSELLDKLNLDKNKVIVEVNLEIVYKEQLSEYVLNKEDKIEIISLMGGG